MHMLGKQSGVTRPHHRPGEDAAARVHSHGHGLPSQRGLIHLERDAVTFITHDAQIGRQHVTQLNCDEVAGDEGVGGHLGPLAAAALHFRGGRQAVLHSGPD